MTKQHEGLPVAGYKPQDAAKVAAVNANKEAEERILRALDVLQGQEGVDQRWLAIGRTMIEQGFMAINRSIFRPDRAALPDDREVHFLFDGYPSAGLMVPEDPITWREAVQRAVKARGNGRLLARLECQSWWIADLEEGGVDDLMPAKPGPRRYQVVFELDQQEALDDA
jgi:hypothetical protein